MITWVSLYTLIQRCTRCISWSIKLVPWVCLLVSLPFICPSLCLSEVHLGLIPILKHLSATCSMVTFHGGSLCVLKLVHDNLDIDLGLALKKKLFWHISKLGKWLHFWLAVCCSDLNLYWLRGAMYDPAILSNTRYLVM